MVKPDKQIHAHRLKPELPVTIGNKVQRKQRARKNIGRNPWFGLGLFGLIGWSIAIPTMSGIWLGQWIDFHWPGPVSWTLTLLFAGLILGCINAWYWIHSEDHENSGD